MVKIFWYIGILLLIASAAVTGHEGEEEETNIATPAQQHSDSATQVIIYAAAILIALTLIALFGNTSSSTMKWLLFLGMAIPIIIATLYSAGSTIYLNAASASKGPVHWHTDFEVWNCGNLLDLKKPEGFSNRIGSALFHEHGDNRIHIEGVISDTRQVALNYFFAVVGGHLSNDHLVIPTDEGMAEMETGNLCDGQAGELQAFLHRVANPEDTGNWIYEQEKLEDFEAYVPAPYGNIPPGDCLIIEFGPEKESTDKICETYEAAIQRGELNGS